MHSLLILAAVCSNDARSFGTQCLQKQKQNFVGTLERSKMGQELCNVIAIFQPVLHISADTDVMLKSPQRLMMNSVRVFEQSNFKNMQNMSAELKPSRTGKRL